MSNPIGVSVATATAAGAEAGAVFCLVASAVGVVVSFGQEKWSTFSTAFLCMSATMLFLLLLLQATSRIKCAVYIL